MRLLTAGSTGHSPPNKARLQSDKHFLFSLFLFSLLLTESSQTLLTKTTPNRSSNSPGSGMGSFNGMLCPLGSVWCWSKLPAFPMFKSFFSFSFLRFNYFKQLSSKTTRYLTNFSRDLRRQQKQIREEGKKNGVSPEAEFLSCASIIHSVNGNLRETCQQQHSNV